MKKHTSNQSIEELLKSHGKREQPDDLMKKRAMKNVKAHWQANLEKQTKKKMDPHLNPLFE